MLIVKTTISPKNPVRACVSPVDVFITPIAFQCLAHPEGELVTARVAAELGTTMVLSTMSTKSLEDVALAANVPKSLWFQL